MQNIYKDWHKVSKYMAMVVNATLNNISGISWQPILFMEETNRSTRRKTL